MSHEHSHGDHHSHGDSDHGHDELEPALQTLIWKQIDFESIRTLNESESDQGAKIVEKTWPQRLNPEPLLESDADEQLLMFVPYVFGTYRSYSQSAVKLKMSTASPAS